MKKKTMKLLLMFLVALGTLAVAPAYAAPCKGEVISADGKLTVGKCWTNDTDAQELIAMACGEGDKCEVYGTITRAREIKRVASTERFACRSPAGEIYFTRTPVGRCTHISLENGWKNFLVERGVIVDFHPTSLVRDGDTVKVWVEFHLAGPVDDSEGRKWQYDNLRASYRFNCKTREQLLIQGTYRLAGKVTYERLSSEAVSEEIEPGTISELLLGALCEQGDLKGVNFEADFTCPEHLFNQEARRAELQRFGEWVRDHPELNTVRNAVEARIKLLTKHGCTETLRKLSRNHD